jgi:hypothetical protein
MTAARARMSAAKDFDLCGMRVIVAEIEGTVQLLFGTDGWPDGVRKVMANVFAHDTTPTELRALADHLETLPLDAPTERTAA